MWLSNLEIYWWNRYHYTIAHQHLYKLLLKSKGTSMKGHTMGIVHFGIPRRTNFLRHFGNSIDWHINLNVLNHK